MTDTQHFDIAIIGSGPGGYSTALRAAELGKSVALIEKDTVSGGTCLHRGCVPSKALLTAAHILRDSQRAEVMGLNLPLQSFDIGKLVDYKESVVNRMTRGLQGLLHKHKVSVITGEASMVSAHELSVTASASPTSSESGENTQGTLTLTADNIVIATGSRSRSLPGAPFSGKAILSSTDALNLHQLPQSVVIIGSGAIGLEFATLWSSAGAKVTILEAADRILPAATPRISATVTRGLKSAGVEYFTDVIIDSVEEGANQVVTVRYHDELSDVEPEEGNSSDGDSDTPATNIHTVTAQFALVAIGRMPNTDAPWFSQLGIELDERSFVKTDAYGRTSLEGVWALGDITPGKQLAHRAFAQGLVIAESIAGVETTPVDDHNVPAVTFAQTEVGFVGYTLEEAEAAETLSDVKENTFPMMGNARVVMSGESGSVTVVSGIDSECEHPGERVVLGVQMAGPGVSELAAEAEQLVGNRIPLHAASRLVHPHPTLSETIGEALLSADGRPLHASR